MPQITSKVVIYAVITLGALFIPLVIIKVGFLAGMVVAGLPMLIALLLYTVQSPYWAYMLTFIANYFLIGVFRYVTDFQGGIFLDALFLSCFAILLIQSCSQKVGWERALNWLTFMAVIWFVYCFLELLNPMAITKAWMRSIRGVAGHFLLISILTPIILHRYKDMKRILLAWAVLTLLAVLKALIQKYVGFDSFEQRWLYEMGGKSTHIIYSGIRYFSFYSDAANFGSGMGFAMVVFSIAAFYYKNKFVRYFFLFVALAAGYGLLISGTRGAIAVPFAGYGLFVLISKNRKAILIGTLMLIGGYIFLNHTEIGNGVATIRRMRTAFNKEDASFQVRVQNQKLMAEHMKGKPFGTGVGMGGGKAKEYAPGRYLSQIPTDSWFVMIWVETGVVGLTIHLIILFSILFTGCYLVMFKIRDKELRGLITAMTCGVFGMMVTSYGNEILGQLPNGFLVYMCQAFIFLAMRYDGEIMENKMELTDGQSFD